MPTPPAVSNEILNAALAGLEAQKKAIHEHIASIRSMLGAISEISAIVPRRRGRPRKQAQALAPASMAETPVRRSAPRKRRRMSAEARRRLAEVARKRWAAAKKAGRTSLG